ncbi:MlaE family lipid ABC transporter permease subunit [Campylobacter sp. LR264d]|uniref:ABC transporter permease n=1 Tax=Campylobacter sp. LR264d TaxID=2593544 RepID=UPI0012386433|nr:ABC transporter permease [Campylobacter sp. LR264d]KAA6231040.1 MlaE family lipid ABC transporter permease subunit [Campylobacter sp. LR264d]
MANFNIQNDSFLLFGSWDKDNIYKLDLKNILSKIKTRKLIIDFKNLKFIDMTGVRFVLALENDLKAKGVMVERINLNERFENLFSLCQKHFIRVKKIQKKKTSIKERFENLGILTHNLFKILYRFINFIGAFFASFARCIKHPKHFRFISFLYHIETSALEALPIIILTSLLVGIVLAYQAANQLQQFGANIFIVDLMGISATRELAPLIVAIVIAGRSASAYTAQIGVMKITDEIAAMNTMGFRSFEFIILPRVMALVIAMPLIVAVGDFISIVGGMIIAQISLDVSAIEFIRRFHEAVPLKHIVIGLVKAPIFGFLIGLIACFRGFEVKNTTQSIGIYTTKSVVNAIFWVIAFDALFSIVLTKMGL